MHSCGVVSPKCGLSSDVVDSIVRLGGTPLWWWRAGLCGRLRARLYKALPRLPADPGWATEPSLGAGPEQTFKQGTRNLETFLGTGHWEPSLGPGRGNPPKGSLGGQQEHHTAWESGFYRGSATPEPPLPQTSGAPREPRPSLALKLCASSASSSSSKSIICPTGGEGGWGQPCKADWCAAKGGEGRLLPAITTPLRGPLTTQSKSTVPHQSSAPDHHDHQCKSIFIVFLTFSSSSASSFQLASPACCSHEISP